ncbi:MAG TPA: sialidase family protein [Labilithrix sp.]|nr:sialidase family protein [Labilithrix sp.]
MRRLLALLSALLVVLAAHGAQANGRFPASNGVIFSPMPDEAVLVRVTFGLLVSRDHAQSWRWICERAIGFSGLEDPSYVVTKSGAIVVGLYDGISVSRDGGCSWERVPTDARVFVDLTERGDGAIVALSSSYDRHTDAGSSFKSQLYLSTDDGRTFVPLGARLDPTLLAESVELAPSNPNRIYISAVRGADATRKGVMLVSDDAGKQWKERALELAPKELAPFIAAVDPTRPDRVYLRTSASPESPTRLLVTDDAAKTYRTLLDAKGPLLGFALAEHGASLHVGGPDDGLFSGRVDAPLTKSAPLKVQCLALQGDVLWACSNEASGFVAGARRGSEPFAARLHLRDIAGPLECPKGSSVAKECETDWRKLRSDLGLDDPPADAGADAGADAAHVLEGVPEPDALRKSRTARVLVILAVLGAAALLVRARRGKR